MRFRFRQPISTSFLRPPRASAPLHSTSAHNSFGIAFDIDGVILRGGTPIGNSQRALKRLYDDSGALKIPFLFLTNGGGIPEPRRALELSDLLGVKILPSQGEPAAVMSEYGFKRVVSLDEYSSNFDNIDLVAQYKRWTTKHESECDKNSKKIVSRTYVLSTKVKAAFVVSDPVDWGRDIQVLCDILTSGGLPGQQNEHQPPLYFAADDLEYQAAFPHERLGMGAFRIALESVFNRIHEKPLQYTSFGKPNPSVYRHAEMMLGYLLQFSSPSNNAMTNADVGSHSLKTLYMIGDNPLVDVKGAVQAGHPWFSILTRTGVFRQKENHALHPADMVVDTVEEAVDFILKRENA
ncbi:cardiolipin synthase (CMP-forming) / mitochondrial hydrolase fusion protein-like isoform X1 [Henckelia pumila]|uniref:cardiolipin synthase (CMP-forming) / mitochondrial hydrolase fusion protein-like isoform X1 n=1 Tax=Henckelia pumila TaxID=405737 RepID=UPI003C6DBC67